MLKNHLSLTDYIKGNYFFIDDYNSYILEDSDINRVIQNPTSRFYLVYDYFKTDSTEIKRWFEYKNNILA
jgi:hypothetical protein